MRHLIILMRCGVNGTTRWMKVELHHGTCIDEKLDKGNLCPACPKVYDYIRHSRNNI